MKEPIRELRCHYLVTCVYNNSTYTNTDIKPPKIHNFDCINCAFLHNSNLSVIHIKQLNFYTFCRVL